MTSLSRGLKRTMAPGRLQLLMAAEKAAAATAAKVFVPGYVIPMTRDEHLQALQRQVQYLQEQHHWHAPAIPAELEWRADTARQSHHGRGCQRCGDRHGNKQSGTSKRKRTLNLPGPQGRSTLEHSVEPSLLAKSNSTTYAQAVMSSDPSLSPTLKRRTRANNVQWRRPSRQRCKLLGDRGPTQAENQQ